MRRMAFMMALLLAQLICLDESFGQHQSRQDTAEKTIRVMTYNIHHANPPAHSGLIDIDAIARVILDAKADVIGLQEVDHGTNRSELLDQTKLLAQKTGFHAHFFKAIDYDGGEYGLAILSRYEMADIQSVKLPQKVEAEKRILAYVTIKVGEQEFIFANTHLDAVRDDGNRIVQIRQILQEFEGVSTPVILCGDLNSVEGSETIQLLDGQFARTCTGDCPGTVPQVKPRRTIDFIATKNVSWTLVEHQVIEETYASDHRPVMAIFRVD